MTQEEKSTAIAQAKGVLLNALEQLEKAEEDLGGEPERVDLVVTYSIGRNDPEGKGWHEIGGWASTSGPKWVHASLLRRAANAQDDSIMAQDEDEEDDE